MLNKKVKNRLSIFIALSVIGILIIIFIFKALEDNVLYFYSPSEIKNKLKNVSGILIPGGFGKRGTEGKIAAIKFARTNKIPFLGICFGMQMAVIEFARNTLKIKSI